VRSDETSTTGDEPPHGADNMVRLGRGQGGVVFREGLDRRPERVAAGVPGSVGFPPTAARRKFENRGVVSRFLRAPTPPEQREVVETTMIARLRRCFPRSGSRLRSAGLYGCFPSRRLARAFHDELRSHRLLDARGSPIEPVDRCDLS
jgi:hypothetical protein